MLRDQGERNDDPMLTAHAKENLGVIAMMQGDYDTYSRLMEEALHTSKKRATSNSKAVFLTP